MPQIPVLIALLFMVSSPAFAAATPWQQIAPGAKLRLISSDIRAADGTTQIGLELDMPPSFSTYWRNPGESGIPARIDIGGSRDIGQAAIDWPYPEVKKAADVIDYVYSGPTVLPITVKLSGPSPLLDLAVTMGVCSDVCVPAKAHFELPISFAVPDPANSIRLRQAEAEVPIPWDGNGPALTTLGYQRSDGVLIIEGLDPAIDPASLIVTPSDPSLVFDAPKKSPDGQALLLKLRGQGGNVAWANAPVELTFMTRKGAYKASAGIRLLP